MNPETIKEKVKVTKALREVRFEAQRATTAEAFGAARDKEQALTARLDEILRFEAVNESLLTEYREETGEEVYSAGVWAQLEARTVREGEEPVRLIVHGLPAYGFRRDQVC